MTGFGLEGQDSILGRAIDFSLFHSVETGCGTPIEWVLGALSPVVREPDREANHSTYSADVKNSGAVSPFPQHVFMA